MERISQGTKAMPQLLKTREISEIPELLDNCEEIKKLETEKMDELENKEKIPQVKQGVDFVFEQNPELEKIGTKEQYSQYLDIVFPESLEKEILYHGTASSQKIENFDFNRSNYGNAVFFTKDKKFAETYAFDEVRNGIVQTEILDVKNIFDYKDPEKIEELRPIISELIHQNYKSPTGVSFMCNPQGMQIGERFIENPSLEDAVEHYIHRLKNGAWRIIETPAIIAFIAEKYDSLKVVEHDRENIAVFNNNQIHVLGSQSDLERFKDFVVLDKNN